MQYVKEKIIDDLDYDKSDEKHDNDIAFGSLQKYAGDDGRYVVVIGKSVMRQQMRRSSTQSIMRISFQM